MGVFGGYPAVTKLAGDMGESHRSVDHPKGLQGVIAYGALGVLRIWPVTELLMTSDPKKRGARSQGVASC
jgi:hypothetical protein